MEEAIFEDIPGIFVGIDLGTSNSVVTYLRNSGFEQVSFKGRKVLPSVLFFEEPDQVTFGERALKKGRINAERLITEFKRDLGTNKKYPISFPLTSGQPAKSSDTYVIDTNIFIHEPYILDSFSDDDQIKLPVKVVDEVAYRAKKDNTSEAAIIALESLEKYRKKSNISFEESHMYLLSGDLETNSQNDINDNRILSIAKYVTQNTVESVYLISNDLGLRIKAQMEGVAALTLNEYKARKIQSDCQHRQHIIEITPKDATRRLLQYIREESQKDTGFEVQKAVITVPANFNQTQIGLVKEAGELAGFQEVKIQKEPIAVGLAYTLDDSSDKTILVYDFGGGTFDASLLKVSDGTMTVIDTNGDPRLGGKDITDKIAELVYEQLLDDHDLDMYDQDDSGLNQKNFKANQRAIWNEAEKAKIELSKYESTNIEIANLILNDAGETENLEFELSRKKFEIEITEIRKKSLDIVKDLISGSGIDRKDIDEIVIAGGTSAIPSIRNSLKDTLGVDPRMSLDTSVVISQGAVIEAMRHWSEEDSVQEIIAFNDYALHDFGIGIKNFSFNVLIPANTRLPAKATRDYLTERDDQESISINIFQRKTSYPDAVKTHDKGIEFIDSLKISGIPKSKVGDFKVRVSFELSIDDTLSLSVGIVDNEGLLSLESGMSINRASDT